MTRLLECSSLSAGYSGAACVRDLTLHVDAGEVISILGPNGAGKTTTLLTICGVLEPMAGTVTFDGAPVRPRKPHLAARRGLAHVPDDRSLFFGLTVRENLQLGARRRSEEGQRVEEVCSYFPKLESLLQRKAGLLSGGEQQMLALGRALASKPKLMLIDEMSLGLAPVIVEGLLPTIRQIAIEHRTAVVLVEQHVDLALEFSDRAYVLSHGDLVLEGTGAELAKRRDVLFASYLGQAALEEER